MAPRRKTIEELKASGTYRPSRHANRDVQPALPPVLEAEAIPAEVQGERNRLAKLLEGRLSETDAPLLTELAWRVVEVRRLRAASQSLAAGSQEHTRVARALTTATSSLDRLAESFGLTPKSKANLPDKPAAPGGVSW